MNNSKAFTIVELLIVIVIIAILAAVTLVAYNGVQSRARASSLTSSLNQADKKLELYKVDNGAYPITGNLASAGITNSSNTTYQYTSDGTTFCITASTSGTSYTATDITGPASGACSGQANGGVVTNLSVNPSVETNSANWSSNWGTSGAGTGTRMTDGGYHGSAYYRMTWSAPATVSWGGVVTNNVPVTNGTTYYASAWVRISRAQSMYVYLRPNTWPTNPDGGGTNVAVPANTWTRLTATYTAPSGVATINPRIERIGSGNWQAGDVMDSDALMVTEGTSVGNYADGGSTGWSWNGAANNSTSTGPPL